MPRGWKSLFSSTNWRTQSWSTDGSMLDHLALFQRHNPSWLPHLGLGGSRARPWGPFGSESAILYISWDIWRIRMPARVGTWPWHDFSLLVICSWLLFLFLLSAVDAFVCMRLCALVVPSLVPNLLFRFVSPRGQRSVRRWSLSARTTWIWKMWGEVLFSSRLSASDCSVCTVRQEVQLKFLSRLTRIWREQSSTISTAFPVGGQSVSE